MSSNNRQSDGGIYEKQLTNVLNNALTIEFTISGESEIIQSPFSNPRRHVVGRGISGVPVWLQCNVLY